MTWQRSRQHAAPRLAALAGLALGALLGAAETQSKPADSAAGVPIRGELFPVCFQNGLYRVPAGFPGVLSLTVKGDARAVRAAAIVFDLPPGIELIGGTSWLPTRTIDNTACWEPEPQVHLGSTRHDEADNSRVSLGINPEIVRTMRPDEASWGRSQRVYLRTWPGLAGKTLKVYWRVRTTAGDTPEESFAVTVLPALEAPPLKAQRFKLMVCKLGHATTPFPEVQDAYFRYWLGLAERPYTLGESVSHVPLSDDLRGRIQRDFRWVEMLGCREGGTPHLNLERWLAFPPLVKADGRAIDTLICPSTLIEDPEGRIWDKAVPSATRQSRLKNISTPVAFAWDLEPGAMEHCFCETCRKGFAAEAGLATVPTAEEIRARHAKAWFDFRVRQHAKINARFAAMIRKHFPKTPYWICTDNLHDGPSILSEWCGCDERLFDPDVDLHLPMIYYSGLQFYKDVALNVRALKKPVFVLVDPAEQLKMFFDRYTPERIRQNILACAALGAVGIGFWPEDYLDGAYLTCIAQGLGLVAEAEDYYVGGTRNEALATVAVEPVFAKTVRDGERTATLTVPAFGEKLQYTVHQQGAGRLITVFNYDQANDVIVRITLPSLPQGDVRVRDVETGRMYVDDAGKPLSPEALDAGFLAKVAANGVVLLEVRPERSLENGIRQSEFRKAFDAARAKLGGAAAFDGATQGAAVAGWGDVDGDGVPEVRLELEHAKAYIDLAGAAVTGWVVKATAEDVVAQDRDRGALGEVVFYDTRGAVAGPWQLAALEVRAGAPTAVFTCRLQTDVAAAGADPRGGSPLDGLQIEKSVALAAAGSALTLKVRLTNGSQRPGSMPAGFRVKNFPRFGVALAGGKPLPAVSAIRLDPPDGQRRITASSNAGNVLFLAPGVSDHPFRRVLAGAKVDAWTPGPLFVETGEGAARRGLAIEPDAKATAGFYSWWGASAFTVEFLSPDVALAPGQTFAWSQTLRLPSP